MSTPLIAFFTFLIAFWRVPRCSGNIPQSELDALKDIYYSMDVYISTIWNVTDNPCVTSTSTWQGVSCNADGKHVSGLNLQIGLGSGIIPDSITELTYLTSLACPYCG